MESRSNLPVAYDPTLVVSYTKPRDIRRCVSRVWDTILLSAEVMCYITLKGANSAIYILCTTHSCLYQITHIKRQDCNHACSVKTVAHNYPMPVKYARIICQFAGFISPPPRGGDCDLAVRILADSAYEHISAIIELYIGSDEPRDAIKPVHGSTDGECVICYNVIEIRAALAPCGHQYCYDCARRLSRCALCTRKISSVVRLY